MFARLPEERINLSTFSLAGGVEIIIRFGMKRGGFTVGVTPRRGEL
jgi:hypothetical protein